MSAPLAPLTPANCNLQDFPRMMLDIPRLRGSEFDTILDDGAWRAGLNLWLTSWHQVPAASLPDDDASLAKHAGLGRDVRTWKKVKAEALRGWQKAADGLLYHPVVAEMALEAWLEKLAQALSSGAGNAKRWGGTFDPAPVEAEIEQTLRMLAALNPKSKALAKASRRKSRPTETGNPDGTENLSRRDTKTVPTGSQETGTGTGNTREESNDPSLAASAAAARSNGSKKVGLPKGYPDDDAVAEAERWIADAGVKLDARAQAKRFRSHALSNGRKLADWPEGWRGWIDIACEEAPKAAPAEPAKASPLTWDGPQDVWDDCVAAMGEAYTRTYLGRSTWQASPPAILARNRMGADVLAKAALGVDVIPPTSGARK